MRSAQTVSLPASETAPELYRAERYGIHTYRFTVPAGRYTLRLHFAETFDAANAKPGRRVFDVAINGKRWLKHFDPLVAGGGFATPVVESATGIPTKKGQIEITFSGHSAQPPMINGIELLGERPLSTPFIFELGDERREAHPQVMPLSSGPPLLRVVCGLSLPAGYSYLAEDGASWLPDRDYIDGAPYGGVGGAHGSHRAVITYRNTTDPALYRHERYGLHEYKVAVPTAGRYTVRLHLSEGFESLYQPGQRVFDVTCAGQTMQDVDPFRLGGGLARATVIEFAGVEVNDGMLSITIHNKVQQGLLNAIEVFTAAPETPTSIRTLTQVAQRPVLAPLPVQSNLRRVLYIGNSHTFFWCIPETVAAMVNTGQQRDWQQPYRYLHGGWLLNNFLTYPNDRSLAIIAAGKYDWVVTQETFSAYTDSEMIDGFSTLSPLALANVERYAKAITAVGSRMMLYAIGDLRKFQPASVQKLIDLTHKYDIVLLPVGDAWASLTERELVDTHGLTLVNDGVHSGFHLGYLTACLHYIACTGLSPIDHPFPYLVGQELPLDPEQAAYIQRLAWEWYQQYRVRYGLISAVTPIKSGN